MGSTLAGALPYTAMMFTVILTLCTIGTGACRDETVPMQRAAGFAPSEMLCIHSAARGILDAMPALITDEGMRDGTKGHESERIRLKSFRCVPQP